MSLVERAKWIAVQVEYEHVYFLANKTLFEQYLCAVPTRMLRSDGKIYEVKNPYINLILILTNRIRELNAKFIRDKSGIRLARVMQLTLKIVKYACFEGRL